MGGWGSGIILQSLAAILFLVAAVWLALWYFIPAPPTTITIAAGLKGGAFEHIANRYREILARRHVTLKLRFVQDPLDNIRLVNDPKSGVAAAFLFAGETNSTESPNLESLGRINYVPLWIFYRGPEPLDRLTQMKGKRVYVTPVIGKLIGPILAANGVNAGNTTMSALVGRPLAAKALRDRDVDAIFLPPIDLDSPFIQSLLRDPSIQLMNVTRAEAITRLFPTLHRLVLPQGAIDLEKIFQPAT